MCKKNTASYIGKIGVLLALALVFIVVSDAAAQCHHSSRSSVRRYRPAVRSVAAYRRVPVRTVYVDRPVYVSDDRSYDALYKVKGYSVRTARIDDGEIIPDADYRSTERIARDYGYRDGWEDGEDAGMERDTYHPENSGDFQKATNGYEDTFGSKHVYRQAYRAAYLKGYKHGFRSIANRGWMPRNQ